MPNLVDKVRSAVEGHRIALRVVQGEEASRLLRIINEVEQDILRALEEVVAGPQLTPDRVGPIMDGLSELVASLLDDEALQRTDVQTINRVMQMAENLRKETTALGFSKGTEFTAISSEHIVDVFQAFETGRQHRALLEHFAGQWQKDIGAGWDATIDRIENEFVKATIQGRPNNELAALIRDDVGQIFETGGMDNEAWARAFVRTKFNEMSNDASVAMAREAGLEYFVNIGVADERQSDICRSASEREPMTLAEWEASDEGKPPRHVLNCRCELVAVPARALNAEWGQEEYVEAKR